MQFRETLRAAKERVRHRLRDPRTRAVNQERRDFWTDEQFKDTDEENSND